MFEVSEKDKKSKLAILKEIMDVMDEQTAGRLSSKKKPVAVEMSVSSIEPDEKEDSKDECDDDMDARLAEKAEESTSDDEASDSVDDDEEDFKRRLMEKLRGK